jgi:hypothetical protein|nr:DUF4184 family protein [Kofleriaceae bacterium]
MPFTGAHPLAITPLVRLRWLDPTSLAIGSMAPDFQYFLYGHEKGFIGHSMLGLVVWCVPVVVIVGLLFHHVVKWPLLVAAPRAVSSRLAASAAKGWPIRPIAIFVSAVIGGATHDLWDSCTHSQGFVVQRFPGLLRKMIDVPGLDQPMILHRVLQYVCSLIGVIVVGIMLWRAVRRRPAQALPELPRWRARLVLLASAAIGTLLVGVVVHRFLIGPSEIVVAVISGSIYGVIGGGLVLWDAGLRARSVSGGRDTTSAWPA